MHAPSPRGALPRNRLNHRDTETQRRKKQRRQRAMRDRKGSRPAFLPHPLCLVSSLLFFFSVSLCLCVSVSLCLCGSRLVGQSPRAVTVSERRTTFVSCGGTRGGHR